MSSAFKVMAVSALSGIFMAMVLASSAAATTEIVVQVGDLNLSNPRDAKELDARLDLAAHELCQHLQFIGTRLPKLSACRADVRQEAKEALDGGAPQFVAVARTAARPDGF